MPKRVHEINPFHGGINSKDDPRDILDAQLVDALNVRADARGTLKTIGNLVDIGTDWVSANDSSSVYPGYGLFRFSADADASGNSGTDDYNTDYLVAWAEATEKLIWFNGSTWADLLDLAVWTEAGSNGERKPIFSYANGALRTCDTNFNNTSNENYWTGYIKRHIFRGSNAASNIAQWFSTTASLEAPTAAPAIKTFTGVSGGTNQTGYIDDDDDTTTNDVSWAITTTRENTTFIWEGADNDANWVRSPSTGDFQTSAGRYLWDLPFSEMDGITDFRVQVDDGGDNSFAESGYALLDTANSSTPINWTGFTIDPTESIYLSAQLRTQEVLDAWLGGYQYSNETVFIFKNLAFTLTTATSAYIKWNIPAEKLTRNGAGKWFVLEFPYEEADENTLGNVTAITGLKISVDCTINRSANEDLDTNVLYFSAGDMRRGEPDQLGNDFFGLRDFAYSFTYDDKKSESLLTDIGNFQMGRMNDTYSPLFNMGCRSFTDKRITGATLYTYEEDTPFMIAEVDFVKGLRGSWETDWPGTDSSTDQWTDVESLSVRSNIIYNDVVPLLESYQARNGYNHKQDSIDARYKSIVITNNKAYVGNVYLDGIHYPDRMIKSQTFDYDAFPKEGRSIEVVQQDGDSIVTLAAYADRIFQFKRNKVHIINITSEQEFLEDSHTGLGIDYPYMVVEMSTGIAWANKNGAYYFDGQKINNITNGLIDDVEWSDHISNAGDRAQVFYVPKNNKIVVVGGANGREIYEYTIHTSGWTRGTKVFDAVDYTNFVLDVDNNVKLLKPSTGTQYRWSNEATIVKDDYLVVTGDLVFDSSAVRKKIYSVHVTHRGLGSAQSVKCWGRPDRAGTWTELGQLDNNTDFTVQEFDVSGVNNARSYQVRLKYFDSDTSEGVSTVPANFEVNDINVVYRSKNVR